MKSFISLFLVLATCFSAEYAEALDSSHQGTAPVYQNSKEIFIKTDDAQIFCRVFGSGDPIIVIHGGPGLSQDYLLPQMAQLAQTNLVIFYDQRGCGFSTGTINADSIQIKTFVDDLEAIRKSFGYKSNDPRSFLGWLSGNAVCNYASRINSKADFIKYNVSLIRRVFSICARMDEANGSLSG